MKNALPTVKMDVVVLKGGLDQVTPTLDLPPGYARSSVNFEMLPTGGIGRVAGYERFNGFAAKPSAATYQLLQLTQSGFINRPTTGQVVTGNTSGATATIVYVDSDWMAITRVTGAFSEGEILRASATQLGNYTASFRGAIDAKLGATITAAAADVYRELIGPVPGSGAILGVWTFNGNVYAFRNSADGLQALMYKATTSGWTQVQLGYRVAFSAGTTAISDGAVVTGAVSGATGTVARASLRSGAWGSDAAGILVFQSITGTFQAGEALRVSGVGVATCGGAQVQNKFSPGGRFEFVNANFYGGISTYRMYGCDGVNPAFEFDGTVFVPLATGFSPDAPKHIIAHKGYLFVSVQTSIGFSAPGQPYNWSALAGAGTIATGDTVTGLVVLPGAQTTGALAVYGTQNTFMLYGTGNTNWNFVTFNTGSGALHYTTETMDDVYALDYRGVVSLRATLNYGNFDTTSVSNRVRPFVLSELPRATDSTINRAKGQYRLFFNDGWGLYLTQVDGTILGNMPVYFPNPVLCSTVDRTSSGEEVTYFGSSNGYVYQLDVGTSFDGQPIAASITLGWNFSKSPRVLKRYRKAAVEVYGNGYCEFDFGYSLQFGSTEYSQPSGSVNYPSSFSESTWDSFTWDSFTWDGRTLSPSECELQGTGENIAISLSSTSNAFPAFSINSVILHYSPRRALR